LARGGKTYVPHLWHLPPIRYGSPDASVANQPSIAGCVDAGDTRSAYRVGRRNWNVFQFRPASGVVDYPIPARLGDRQFRWNWDR